MTESKRTPRGPAEDGAALTGGAVRRISRKNLSKRAWVRVLFEFQDYSRKRSDGSCDIYSLRWATDKLGGPAGRWVLMHYENGYKVLPHQDKRAIRKMLALLRDVLDGKAKP